MADQTGALAGRRVLVVGASAGIGRAVAEQAAAAGARVVGAARRAGAIPQGDGLVAAIGADVRDAGDCQRLVREAEAALGGLDALVYAPALLPLARLVDTDAEAWRAVLETSVIGASLVTGAAIGALVESRGRAVYLSSDSVPRPRPGLVAYIAGKAALEAMVAGWRAEVDAVTFSCVVVGPTLTDIASGWDPDLAGEMFALWAAGRFGRYDAVMTADEVAREIVRVLASPVAFESLTLQPMHPPSPDASP